MEHNFQRVLWFITEVRYLSLQKISAIWHLPCAPSMVQEARRDLKKEHHHAMDIILKCKIPARTQKKKKKDAEIKPYGFTRRTLDTHLRRRPESRVE